MEGVWKECVRMDRGGRELWWRVKKGRKNGRTLVCQERDKSGRWMAWKLGGELMVVLGGVLWRWRKWECGMREGVMGAKMCASAMEEWVSVVGAVECSGRVCCKLWAGAHWKCVDQNGNDENKENTNDGAKDVPLVVLPNDHLERLPGGSEPQEGRCRAAGRKKSQEVIGSGYKWAHTRRREVGTRFKCLQKGEQLSWTCHRQARTTYVRTLYPRSTLESYLTHSDKLCWNRKCSTVT